MENREGNIRIAKNTVIVYIRMAVTIIVGLITTRLVLKALGIDDYGIYGVVGSVVTAFGFISAALSSTTQRFLNYEMGRKDGDPGRMFNICNVLHIGCALVLFILIETAGLIYILNFLNVAPGKEADAMFVFQVSTLVACIGIMNVPFQSLFTVHERFSTVAVIDICLNLVKLGLVALLLFYKGNCLRLYAVLMAVSTLASFIIYHILSRKNWPSTVRWKFVRGWDGYREAFSFSNFNLLSQVAVVARAQGSNMLINFFFGTGVNAAYGIANTVFNYVNRFTGNIDFAATPQITQNYSSGDRGRSHYLACTVGRLSLLVILAVFFTVLPEMEGLLRLWLGPDMPPGAPLMCFWTLIFGIVSTTSAGIVQVINASGRIKWFKIQYCIVYVLVLVFGYLAFRAGAPAHTIIIISVIGEAVAKMNYLILAGTILGYPSFVFVKKAFTRPVLYAVAMVGYVLLYRHLGLGVVSGTLLSFVVACVLAVVIGLKPSEKRKMLDYVSMKLKPAYRRFMLKHFHSTLVDRQWKTWKGYKVDWESPRDLNEKIQWLMCKGDTSEWTRCADKVAVRDYVEEKGLGNILMPIMGVWERSSDIPWDSLPEKFVLKCSHDSGSTVVVEKPSSDRAGILSSLDERLKVKYGFEHGEMYYNGIPPRIIAEPFIEDGGNLPADYKVWCFNGRPYAVMVCSGRTDGYLYLDVYDTGWNHRPDVLAPSDHYRDGGGMVPRPECLEEMLSAAAALSEGFPEVRVDFFISGGKLLFGEMTFSSLQGKMDYYTGEFLREMGENCKLPTGR
ncbi:MAG: hypothetical protein IJK96_00435 [Bacteroidales bacterium]|nr:hypothetical protein [Bacteroidales bacterium]